MTSNSHPFDLRGHVALVTGGNSGIGFGMAAGLASAGAAVAIWGSNAARNEEAADELRRHGQRVLPVVCDVGDEQQVAAATAETLTGLGQIDSCFANAGIGGHSLLVDLTLAEWRRVMRVNAEGTFLTMRAVARHMIERGGGGSLIATSSLAATEGVSRSSHYAASKAAVGALVRTLAVELARHRIRANAILPGAILTPMSESTFTSAAAEQRLLPRVPARRWGVPADLAGIAVYLASSASAYHSGDSFTIDGGFAIA
ncbi:MAG: SDR family NAD(P)-dependent oxidoreductase [Acidimicrobiia bacterium]